MNKIGYIFLASIYFISFTIGNTLYKNSAGNNFFESMRYERLLDETTEKISKAMSVNVFFDYISEGL